MNKLWLRLITCALVGLLVGASNHGKLLAQEEDFFDQIDSEMPADDEGFEGFDDEVGDLDEGFGNFGADGAADADGGAAPDRPAADETGAAEVVGEHQAFVQAIQDSNPRTAEELYRAVDGLIRVGRLDVAGIYLKQLNEMSLDDVALARLEREFGSAAILRLMKTTELAPASFDFGQRVMEASRRVATDPTRLDAWVKMLGAESRPERGAAATNLFRAGSAAIEPIIRGVDQTNEVAVSLGQEIMVRLGDDAVDPLIGELSNTDGNQRTLAINTLGKIGSRVALPYLIGPSLMGDRGVAGAAQAAVASIVGQAPTQADAERYLALKAGAAYRGIVNDTVDPSTDRLARWIWDAEQNRVVRRELRRDEAAALAAKRMYGDLQQIRPDHSDYKLRHVISRLDFDQLVGGLDAPLPTGPGSTVELIKQSGMDLAGRALRRAIADEHEAAAIGAVKVLGESSDPAKFARMGDRPSALAEALIHPNRRLRFAAAVAAVEMDLPASFDGAGRVADVLGYFAATDGRPVVLVAHPRWSEGRRIAGLFGQRGFRTQVVTMGRDLIRAARKTPDIELIVLSDRLNPLSAWDTIEELRANPKTNQLPLAVLARIDRMVTAERLAFAQGGLPVIVEAIDSDALLAEIPRLLPRLDRNQVSVDQRIEQAVTALNLLDKWLSRTDRHPPLVVLSDHLEGLVGALYQVETVGPATRVLSRIGSPTAQTALVDLASDSTRSSKVREAAVLGFNTSAARFGLLLNREQVLRQYKIYNGSRDLPRETQSLLSSVLDIIEDPHGEAEQAEAAATKTADEIR